MLKHTKGNLLNLAHDGEFDVIVHGCNCFCTMGSGIAREIRERYPTAYMADISTEQGDYNKLGNFSVAPSSLDSTLQKNVFLIVNAYTQYGFNRPGESDDVFEYEAFKLILQKLAHQYPTERFGLPYIGQGLAGGDREAIIGMIEEFAYRVTDKGGSVTLVEFG